MSNLQKIVVLSVVALVLAGVGYAGLMIWQDRIATEVQDRTFVSEDGLAEDESTVLDTSDWQTYRNKEFAFEFQYPPSPRGGPPVYIGERETPLKEYLAELEILRSTAYEGDPSVQVLENIDTTVAGRSAVRQEYSGLASGLFHLDTLIDISPNAIATIYTRGEGTVIDGKATIDDSMRNYHEKILSTFRFIDTDDLTFLEDETAQWGTFREKDYEVEYPLNWVVAPYGRNNVSISTFVVSPPFAQLSPGVAVISIEPLHQSTAYSLDLWIDIVGRLKSLDDGIVILERNTIPEIEGNNRIITYRAPSLGHEGKIVYIQSDQGFEGVTAFVRVVYEIHLRYNRSDQMADQYKAVLDQVLSTFRILNE